MFCFHFNLQTDRSITCTQWHQKQNKFKEKVNNFLADAVF